MCWSIGIGIGLKIDNKLFGSVIFIGSFHALLDLLANGWKFPGKLGSERIYVTIGTSPVTFAPITVWAGKSGISNNLIYALPIVLIFKISAIMIIILVSVI